MALSLPLLLLPPPAAAAVTAASPPPRWHRPPLHRCRPPPPALRESRGRTSPSRMPPSRRRPYRPPARRPMRGPAAATAARHTDATHGAAFRAWRRRQPPPSPRRRPPALTRAARRLRRRHQRARGRCPPQSTPLPEEQRKVQRRRLNHVGDGRDRRLERPGSGSQNVHAELASRAPSAAKTNDRLEWN